MNTQNTPASASAFPVGFSILRTGQGEKSQACLVTPWGGRIDNVNLVDDKLMLRVGSEELVLHPIPQDVRDLIAAAPGNVLLVSVDILSRVRQSTPLGGLVTH